MSGVTLELDSGILQPLIRQIVAETLVQVEGDLAKMNDKIAYSEEEAARLLGLQSHNLRDARLRGNIQCSQITGRRIRYTREDLVAYLAANRWTSKGG